MSKRKSRLAGIIVAEEDRKGCICSFCGSRIAENPKDPVVMANSFDEAMKKLKKEFHSKAGTHGTYHFDCAMGLRKLVEEKEKPK